MDASLSNNDHENICETLGTKGWDLLVEGFEEQFEACNQVVGCDSDRDLFTRRGMMIVLQQLIDLRDDYRIGVESIPLGEDPDADL